MATNELTGMFKYIDEEGNVNVLMPPKASAVPDAAGDTVTAEEFNNLLESLRNAGYLSTE